MLLVMFYNSGSQPVGRDPLGKEVERPSHWQSPRPPEISVTFTMIRNSSKISYEVATKIILWLGTPQHEELD